MHILGALSESSPAQEIPAKVKAVESLSDFEAAFRDTQEHALPEDETLLPVETVPDVLPEETVERGGEEPSDDADLDMPEEAKLIEGTPVDPEASDRDPIVAESALKNGAQNPEVTQPNAHIEVKPPRLASANTLENSGGPQPVVQIEMPPAASAVRSFEGPKRAANPIHSGAIQQMVQQAFQNPIVTPVPKQGHRNQLALMTERTMPSLGSVDAEQYPALTKPTMQMRDGTRHPMGHTLTTTTVGTGLAGPMEGLRDGDLKLEAPAGAETRTQQSVIPAQSAVPPQMVVAPPQIFKPPIAEAFDLMTRSDQAALGDDALSPVSSIRTDAPQGLAAIQPALLQHPQLPQHIARQLVEAMNNGAKGPVDVALNPEELGKVRMRISMQEGGIVISIFAERPETLELMRRNADELSQEFKDQGFGSVRFGFDTADGEPAGDPHDQSAHDGAQMQDDEPRQAQSELPAPRTQTHQTQGVDIRL